MLSSRRRIGAYLLAVVALVFGCRSPSAILTGLHDARRLTAELRVQFSKSVDASNRAVIADTDELSHGFARESEQATRALERQKKLLAPLLQSLALEKESQLLAEFDDRFSKYQELDRSILKLAVENTNIKAQDLSFGLASQTAASLDAALKQAAGGFPEPQRCRVDGLVAQARLSVRGIQVLYAPHIAEHDAAAMTRMEQELATLDANARAALQALNQDAPPAARAALADAFSALDTLKSTTEEIVVLSRRNTNVVSLDLALRQRPALAAACDDRLRALEEALAAEGTKATR